MSRQEVLSTLRAQQAVLHARFGVARLALFGSVARDEAGQDSDVDLLVEFDRPVGLFRFMELQSHLEDLLGCGVDLGTPQSLKPRIRDRVLAEAVDVQDAQHPGRPSRYASTLRTYATRSSLAA